MCWKGKGKGIEEKKDNIESVLVQITRFGMYFFLPNMHFLVSRFFFVGKKREVGRLISWMMWGWMERCDVIPHLLYYCSR